MQMENKSTEPTILHSLRREADKEGRMSYADFVRVAAFDPNAGYYAKTRKRVGRSRETDFYTAESLGSVFGKLVVAAAIDLLGSEEMAAKHIFVEIGAEPDHCVLDGVDHPFAEILILRLGDTLRIPERALVFANEWLDALPFNRLRFDEDKGWRELGVMVKGDVLEEIVLPSPTPEVQSIFHRLPKKASDGYRLDVPLGARDALRKIASQKWWGAFLTFDYGKSWEELTETNPNGTARAYEKHRSHSDLLTRPGDRDLTCHLCWDFLIEVLREEGFAQTHHDRQEAFLMKHATKAIRGIVEARAPGMDEGRQTLQELLHPARMGDAFQALGSTRVPE